MSYEMLQVLWFILIAVLFTGFFFLEGFDYGVGTLLPFVAKNDKERRVVINTIGPFWDGNEVWLLTAGGAMFAAFPNWYATMFSGFYLALVVILVALILRGVAFEFRSKDKNTQWRRFWDFSLFFGSAVPALLWGVAVGNLVRGIHIGENMQYTGTFFDLLNPYALVGGVVTLGLFTLHGALFLTMKTDGVILERVQALVPKLWIFAIGAALVFAGFSLFETQMMNPSENPYSFFALPLAAVVMLIGFWRAHLGKFAQSFLATGLTIVLVVIAAFGTMFPNAMIALDPQYSMHIQQASSSEYTLGVMTVIALFFVPIVLGYQAWSYWVFRQRVTLDSHLEY